MSHTVSNVQPTGTQLASLAQTLAQEEFDSDVAVGVLERASGHGRALEAAQATLSDRIARNPGDFVAKQALELVETALEQHVRAASAHPQYVHCGNCGHKGAYLVADRPIVRCKYCSAVLTLSDEERAAAEADLVAFATRLG
jgi:ribosomal protein S27E